MSLRTGGQVATVLNAIINPNNLKIEGFYCEDKFEKKQKLVLLSQDIRDIVPQGVVVNDHDVLTSAEELIRLKDIMALNFELIGKPVHTEKKRLGKVNDFAIETETMFIQKLYVSRSLVKNFSGGGLSVDRGQIIEITSRKIVIKDPVQPIVTTETQSVVAPAVPAT